MTHQIGPVCSGQQGNSQTDSWGAGGMFHSSHGCLEASDYNSSMNTLAGPLSSPHSWDHSQVCILLVWAGLALEYYVSDFFFIFEFEQSLYLTHREYS